MFALAPILVLWLGYGMVSKVAMATLIIYFPVTAAFHDGLRRTDPGWLDLARTMNATRWAVLRHVRAPRRPARPGLGPARGRRPWHRSARWSVNGSDRVPGSDSLMLHANARMQVDLMFAALVTLAAVAVALFFFIDGLLRRALPWQPDTSSHERLRGLMRKFLLVSVMLVAASSARRPTS